jgi:hypothetical protein
VFVGARVGGKAVDLLRRHVVDGADGHSLRGQLGGGVGSLRDAEVGQIRPLLAIDDRDQWASSASAGARTLSAEIRFSATFVAR